MEKISREDFIAELDKIDKLINGRPIESENHQVEEIKADDI